MSNLINDLDSFKKQEELTESMEGKDNLSL